MQKRYISPKLSFEPLDEEEMIMFSKVVLENRGQDPSVSSETDIIVSPDPLAPPTPVSNWDDDD